MAGGAVERAEAPHTPVSVSAGAAGGMDLNSGALFGLVNTLIG